LDRIHFVQACDKLGLHATEQQEGLRLQICGAGGGLELLGHNAFNAKLDKPLN
jgi:hypothetical protein